MFRRLVTRIALNASPNNPPNVVRTEFERASIELFSLHPLELTDLLERAWNQRSHEVAEDTGHPLHRSNTPGLSLPQISVSPPPPPPPQPPPPQPPVQQFRVVIAQAQHRRRASNNLQNLLVWDHLIYAYMIENTRVYEIFRRVLHELLHGEKLGSPREDTLLWLRSTEELVYRAQSPFFITTLDSHIRPDLSATRRNAYQRMFGMDLNHGKVDNTPYPYVKADAANNEFVTTFVDFLREIEIARTHLTATSAVNPTDNAKIAELGSKVHDMLITRRQFGNISREEFAFVSMMSWFHLTLSAGNAVPIIRDLRAEGSSPEQRLYKIAQRVGLPSHGRSRGFFEIAEAISALLIIIESNLFNDATTASGFYDTGVSATVPPLVNTVSTHWDEISPQKIRGVKVVPA